MQKIHIAVGITFFAVVCFSCTSKLYSSKNKVYEDRAKAFAQIIAAPPRDSVYADSLKVSKEKILTTNFGMRKPNAVIIHYTAQNSCEKTLETFTQDASQVSAHYVICRDGTLHHMLNDYLRAWHAGAGKWGNNTDINSTSVGIEIDNNGKDSFFLAQLNTLYGVLAYLKKAYNIPAANFIGHSDIAPGRKIDPGILFPWKTLANKGYGLWYADTTGLKLPESFSSNTALRIIGYDISDLTAAMISFRMHWIGNDKQGEFDDPEKKILYAVMLKFLD